MRQEGKVGDQPLFFGRHADAATSALTRCVTVTEVGVYRGPHYYSHTPMIRIQLDLGWMEEWPSHKIDGFADRLLGQLPGLERHGCSYKRRGGFVKRLRAGTWFGHIVEHVALELQSMAGDRVTRGKTRSVKGRPGVYNVMFAYRDESVGLQAGRIALELVHSLLPSNLRGLNGLGRIARLDGDFDLESRMEGLRRQVRATSLGPTTQALVDEAKRRGIPVLRLDRKSLIQLGHGRKQQRIRASITGRTSLVAVDIAGDKDLTKSLLGDRGLPVSLGELVMTIEEAIKVAKRLRFPLVTKPVDGNHGRGVTTGIANEMQLRSGFAAAAAQGRRGVILEEQFIGHDHRILVIGGELVAVAERVPARVIGDGVGTIRQLIDNVNADPRRGNGHEKVMTRIRIDDAVRVHRALGVGPG
jgi:cyanophycin synthetase